MRIIRTQEEVDEVRNQAIEGIDQGSKFPGLSYEDGIEAVLRWLFGETDEHPLE